MSDSSPDPVLDAEEKEYHAEVELTEEEQKALLAAQRAHQAHNGDHELEDADESRLEATEDENMAGDELAHPDEYQHEQGFTSGEDGGHDDSYVGGGNDNAPGGDESFATDDNDDGMNPNVDGNPDDIQAPAGSSDATNEAAARLAKLMADADEAQDEHEADGGNSYGLEGADEEMDLEARQRRKREALDIERELNRASGKRASAKRASGAASRRGDEEEKETASSSHRSGRRVRSTGDDIEDDVNELLADDGGEYGESDYGSDMESDEEGGDDEGVGPDEEEDEIRTEEDVLRAKEEREHLIEVNKIRQRQIALILEREKSNLHGGKGSRAGAHTADDKGNASGMDPSSGSHPEQLRMDYIKNLEALNLLWDELESKREEAEEKIDRLTAKLDAQDEKCTELSDSFKSFKREIAKEARFSRTGKPIKLKRILAFEAAEESKDREVARVRLRHINLLNELRSLEEAVRTKEKLAEGLHLIDFEQLKIENQTLNEKIEERNDELHKLKKKTTTTVQVLTHIKEKLQCVREENSHAASELRTLSYQVTQLRDTLTRAKHARDEGRNENQTLKQKQGFIGSDLLVSDFENRKGDIDVLRAKVEGLKTKWRNLNSLSLKASSVERMQARMESQASAARQSHYATVKFGGGAAESMMGNINGLRR